MSTETKTINIATADPSALGLFGLAIVTLVASSAKLEITSGVSLIIPWALFLGSIAQLIASAHDFKKGNTFGATAFGAYGLFWAAVGMTWMVSAGVFGASLAGSVDNNQLGFAFLGYLIFTIVMTIGATETHKVLLTIFVLIIFLFLGLTISSFATGGFGEFGHKMAAYSELLISLVSFYGFAAALLNTHFGRVFLPVGKPLGIFKK